MINIANKDNIQKIIKPWGSELWIANGKDTPYALKKINIKKGHKSSIQFHEFKFETIFLLEGEAYLHFHHEKIDIDKFKSNKYSDDDISFLINSLSKCKISPGESFSVIPGQIHSVEAISDITIIEASTTELEDVFRLRDEFGRQHGKVPAEHQT
tara:strand:+ start:777 stop:1241 length:465 start_codon:yes stop_codon:yes gene_type:complete